MLTLVLAFRPTVVYAAGAVTVKARCQFNPMLIRAGLPKGSAILVSYTMPNDFRCSGFANVLPSQIGR